MKCMEFTIECEEEEDGRWIAEVLEVSGALAYGATLREARLSAQCLAARILADRIDHREA
jgi:predicted RNase H-like HicB family nuclease